MSRLRRWKKRECSLLIPALTRWAKVCRASSAGRNANALLIPALTRWAKVCRAYGARTRPSRHGPEERWRARHSAGARNLRCRAPAKGGTREETRSRAKARPLQTLRAELACGEIFQGAKTAVEFGGRQAALAVESAQKIPGRTVALARVAFETAGNQVAVGIASQAHAWHDVVEALHVGGSAAEPVKAGAAFAIVNGLAER